MNTKPDEPERTDAGWRVYCKLTPRQRTVVQLLAGESLCNREIAERMGIQYQVVKNYMRDIFDRTGMSNRLELAMFAVRHGLVEDDK